MSHTLFDIVLFFRCRKEVVGLRNSVQVFNDFLDAKSLRRLETVYSFRVLFLIWRTIGKWLWEEVLIGYVEVAMPGVLFLVRVVSE